MGSKSRSAFRTIAEVAEELGVATHVLRFWETKFKEIAPMKASGGRRYYRPDDVEVIRLIKDFLYNKRYTIEGVQKLLKENGAKDLIGGEIQKDFFVPRVDEPQIQTVVEEKIVDHFQLTTHQEDLLKQAKEELLSLEADLKNVLA